MWILANDIDPDGWGPETRQLVQNVLLLRQVLNISNPHYVCVGGGHSYI